MGSKLTNCCMPEPVGTKEFGKMVKRIQTLEEGESPSQRGKELENRGKKEKNHEKGASGTARQF